MTRAKPASRCTRSLPSAPRIACGSGLHCIATATNQYIDLKDGVADYAWENKLNRIVVPTPDAWLGIMTTGKTYYDVREALRELEHWVREQRGLFAVAATSVQVPAVATVPLAA